MKLLKRILAIAGILLALAIAGFLTWALWIPAPMPEALVALASDQEVAYEEYTGGFAFRPQAEQPTCGLFFFPGGRVDPRAYAPTLRTIAAAGYLVATESVPLNLAILEINAAQNAAARFPEIIRWAVGGHSLGGSVATFYAHDNPQSAQGLALWAAYATEGRPLTARTELTALSLSASNDGMATPQTIDAARVWLPPDTTFIEIAGGNHAQFGWYGEQRGDTPATITRIDQHAQTVAATVALLNAMCSAPNQ